MGLRPRDILRDNLDALMRQGKRRITLVEVVAESGVSKGVVERMTKAQANTGIDHLAGVAQVFGLRPWQLLDPATGNSAPEAATIPTATALTALVSAITALPPTARKSLADDLRLLAEAPDSPGIRQRVLEALQGGDSEESTDGTSALMKKINDSSLSTESKAIFKKKTSPT